MNKNTGKNNQNSPFFDQISNLIMELIPIFLMVLFSGFILTRRIYESKPWLFANISFGKKVFCLISTCTLGLLLMYLFTISKLFYWKMGYFSGTVWFGSVFISLIYYFFISRHKDSRRITTKNLRHSLVEFDDLYEKIQNSKAIPIGKSIITNEPILVPIELVKEHCLNSGATGQGKTTQLITKVSHYILHNRPVVIIDPKGQKSDVDQIRAIAKACGREKDFKLFSLSFPTESLSYNPIAVGTPVQRKDKLLSGLELNHEYYGNKANEYLGAIFDAHHFLNIDLDISKLHEILINKKEFSKLENKLRETSESEIVQKLLNQLGNIRQISEKDLSGLIAQLGTMNSIELGPLLKSNSLKEEINMLEVFQKKQIAYFQMNVNGYQKIARQIGKLIVQDLRLVSNIFQSEVVKREFDHAICFIDEFGSFATKDFADFLKMTRSSEIGCDLSFQGIADLKAVSPEFADQIIGNTTFKTILRQDVNDDVETWSAMAGTEDYEIESKQVQTDPIFGKSYSGMGNMHIGKRVLIEFDVFKKLKKGQAIFINKARHSHDLISIWNIKNEILLAALMKKSKQELKNTEHQEKIRRLDLRKASHRC